MVGIFSTLPTLEGFDAPAGQRHPSVLDMPMLTSNRASLAPSSSQLLQQLSEYEQFSGLSEC